jgi:hypothetical protein
VTTDAGRYEGGCHCGAIAVAFHTLERPHRWRVRSCQCSFCRVHGARTTADPRGSIEFHVADTSKLVRYQFGTRSTDFLLCRQCGVYVAALLVSPVGSFATLNINAIDMRFDVPEAQPVSYDGESVQERISRREQRWTPVAAAP